MSESNNSSLELEDLDQGGNDILRSIYACTGDELSLPDGIHDAYLSDDGVILRIKTNGQMLEVQTTDIDFATATLADVTQYINNFQLGIGIRNLTSNIKGQTYQAIRAAEHEAAAPTPNIPQEDAEFEFIITRRDGSTEIRTATRYNLTVVLKEIELELENEAKLGVMCDNMEIDLALKEEVQNKKGLSSLNKRVYLTETAMHEKNLARIAAGEITEKAYRKTFN